MKPGSLLDDIEVPAPLAMALKRSAADVPAAHRDLSGVRRRARRHQRRRASVTGLAVLTAVTSALVAGTMQSSDGQHDVATQRDRRRPADALVLGSGAVPDDRGPSGVHPRLEHEGNVLAEPMPDGSSVVRWRSSGGWAYAGGAVKRPDGRMVVGVDRPAGDQEAKDGGDPRRTERELAVQVAEPDGTVVSTHEVTAPGRYINVIDATDTGVVLDLYANDGVGDARMVWHDLATGDEQVLVESYRQELHAPGVGGGTLADVRPSTCALETFDLADPAAPRTFPGPCTGGAAAAAGAPLVSPDGRLVAVEWTLDGHAEGALTVVDVDTGTTLYTAAYPRTPATGDDPVDDFRWTDGTTLQVESRTPADIPTDAEGITLNVVPLP
jgi:hypothetical protein